ncbi:PREDICTED: phospholipase A-2-activating protein-like [Priapulus caudatus]|uniref:Phospholipase A-2-activating protein-like n=1 Tax=Priapulus caudatus TaxID=37621 RepID=A0ABM1EMF9_PRICU|nr:PREDICTED: phospholipase A-2-activating protein-like [Priapulus caudatus]
MKCDSGFSEVHSMGGHTNFISCICVIPPDEKYPHGLILTGSHDKTICAFSLDSAEAVFKLCGHTDTVSCLAVGKFGTILSGSWDMTAKVWLNQKLMMTLQGHEFAIWAGKIMPECGVMLTGSADKTIKMWKAGKCERTFQGHTDCVRGLEVLSAVEFLSCSNDSSIRRWLVTGECIQIYSGHTSFIYSIAVLPNGQDFVSAGEDRSLKVWKNDECTQTLFLPAESIWSVSCLLNGDIIAGSSDGVARVFTTDPGRMASEEHQHLFQEEVASFKIAGNTGDLGEIKVQDLPDERALLVPGNRDGQTKMVKTPTGNVEAYQWSAAECQWSKIGDVIGSAGASPQTSGKVLYEGKEYDYVFSIDVEEGKPPLKLPYNITDDPWFAAQKFLNDNELSQSFLDQVANFITENAKGVTIQQSVSATVDPYTGGARYIPGNGSNSGSRNGLSDPFTGAGRYVPTGNVSPKVNREENAFFPVKKFVSFQQRNPNAIVAKLVEFNARVDADNRVPEDVMASEVRALLKDNHVPTDAQMVLLEKLLRWPKDVVFPALDVLRLALCNRHAAARLCDDRDGPRLVDGLLALAAAPDNQQANVLLGWRALCNVFVAGAPLMLARRDEVVAAATACAELRRDDKKLLVATATLLLNYAAAGGGGGGECVVRATVSVLRMQPDREATFRLLVALGTLLWDDGGGAVELARSLGASRLVAAATSVSDPPKVSECALHLTSILL